MTPPKPPQKSRQLGSVFNTNPAQHVFIRPLPPSAPTPVWCVGHALRTVNRRLSLQWAWPAGVARGRGPWVWPVAVGASWYYYDDCVRQLAPADVFSSEQSWFFLFVCLSLSPVLFQDSRE